MKYKLGDICLINKQSYSVKDNYKFVNYLDTGNITKNSISQIQYIDLSSTRLPSRAKRIVRHNDIIYSTVRPNQEHHGFIKDMPDNFLVSTGFTVLTPNQEKVNPYWLYCYLTQKTITDQMQLIAEQNVSTYPSIRPENLAEIELELPDLETQRKIVRILSALDQKIELNNQILEELNQISATVFKDIYENMGTSEEISLGELCNIKYGKNLPSKNLLECGYAVYGANGIIGYYSEKMYNSPQVLVSCRGVAGAVHISEPNSFVTNNSLVLECDDKFHYFIKEYSLSRKYDDYATGSAQPQITINNIKDHKLKIPIDDNELYNFNNICSPLENQYFLIIEQNKVLNKLRDTLLPKLMSGEINLDRAIIDE